jgi:hypothetical protein
MKKIIKLISFLLLVITFLEGSCQDDVILEAKETVAGLERMLAGMLDTQNHFSERNHFKAQLLEHYFTPKAIIYIIAGLNNRTVKRRKRVKKYLNHLVTLSEKNDITIEFKVMPRAFKFDIQKRQGGDDKFKGSFIVGQTYKKCPKDGNICYEDVTIKRFDVEGDIDTDGCLVDSMRVDKIDALDIAKNYDSFKGRY